MLKGSQKGGGPGRPPSGVSGSTPTILDILESLIDTNGKISNK
jgi:hypothetical protein